MPFWDPNSLPYVIDWDAWSTMGAGVLAVGAAIVIGRRQAAIMSKQTDTLDRQARVAAQLAAVEAARFRAELYDRRVQLLGRLERFISEASGNDGRVSNEVRDDFFRAQIAAAHLFNPAIEALAKEVYRVVSRLRIEVGQLERADAADEIRRQQLADSYEANLDRLTDLSLELRSASAPFLSLVEERPLPPAAPA